MQNSIDLRLIHKGQRILCDVKYDTDKSFDGDGPDIILQSVSHEGREILTEMDTREVEQLECHIREVKRNEYVEWKLDQREDR